MTNGLLGMAMIVKDGSETLEAALRSAKKYCSQLVVVDTGSHDHSKDIAYKFGSEVFTFEWTDSFSEARNYALSKMRTDWILVLDSDEVLSKIDVGVLKNADENIGGLTVQIVNALSEDDDLHFSTHRYTRIFRNNYGFRFEGRIHEQIRGSIEHKQFKIADSDFVINHYGYNKINQTKLARNQKLLQMDFADKPDDAFTMYHLAHTLHARKEYENAHALFARIVSSPVLSDEQRDFARLRVAQTKLLRDEYDFVIKLLINECSNNELEGLRKFILGAVYFAKQQYKKSYEFYTSPEVFDSGMTDKSLLQKVLPALQKVISH